MKQELSISVLLQLQSTLRKEASKAQSAVYTGAYKEMNGEEETDSVSLEVFETSIERLDEINALSIQVADKLHEANRGTAIVHTTAEGKTVNLNLASALDYVKQVRSKSEAFQRLGNAKPKQVDNVYGSTEKIVKTRMYDIEAYASKAVELEKEANRLSREIERQSVLVMVEVEGVESFL